MTEHFRFEVNKLNNLGWQGQRSLFLSLALWFIMWNRVVIIDLKLPLYWFAVRLRLFGTAFGQQMVSCKRKNNGWRWANLRFVPVNTQLITKIWSVRVAERLALPTAVHGVAGSNPAGGEILPEPKRRFIAQSLSCSPFHRLEMTEILLKGRKTLTHPSITKIDALSIRLLCKSRLFL